MLLTRTMPQKALALTLALCCALALSACGAKPEKVEFTPSADIEAKLTNYKITVLFTGEDGAKTEMTELRCEQGYIWAIGDSLLYVDYESGNQYQLYQKNKTGIVTKLNNGETYKKIGAVMSAYIFFHEPYVNLDMKESSGGKVAGRNTTAYTFTYNNETNKFWIDNEYGITVKYSAKTNGKPREMEVKELKIGDVTLADMVDLSKYDIVDLK